MSTLSDKPDYTAFRQMTCNVEMDYLQFATDDEKENPVR